MFLHERSQILEAVESSKNMIKIVDYTLENKNDSRKSKLGKNNNKSTSLLAVSEIKCYVCELAHTIYKCPTFLALTVDDRIRKVKELELCKVCLRKHDFKRCLSQNNCYKCRKARNTLLHLSQQNRIEKASDQQTLNISTSAHASNIDRVENVLLSTAVVRAVGMCTRSVLCRALLDSGSQSNFITEEIVQTLRIKKIKTSHKINGIGSVTQRVHSFVHARFDNYEFSLYVSGPKNYR